MVNNKTILIQSVVLVAIILCMQAVMGQIVPNAPAGCNCYLHGGSGTRTPCGTNGCSSASNQNCDGDTSLFLFYPNATAAGSPNSTVGNGSPGSPSLDASRYGACSCPSAKFLTYGGSANKDNAYFVTSGNPSGNAFHNISSCDDFGKLAGGATNNQAVACCTACCFPTINIGD